MKHTIPSSNDSWTDKTNPSGIEEPLVILMAMQCPIVLTELVLSILPACLDNVNPRLLKNVEGLGKHLPFLIRIFCLSALGFW